MPPAFVLSQDQTLQTKLLKPHQLQFFISFFKIESWRKSLRICYNFLLRLQNSCESQNHFSGSSHYSIFKDHFYIFSSLCIKRNRDHNLASIFVLSSDFLNFFQKFFLSTASFKLVSQTHQRSVWGYNLAPIFVLSSDFLNFFKTFLSTASFRFVSQLTSEAHGSVI